MGQIIYQSPWGSDLPVPPSPLNLWDFIRARIPDDDLKSSEARWIQVESVSFDDLLPI